MSTQPQRTDIPEELTWRLEGLFVSREEYLKRLLMLERRSERFQKSYQGKLNEEEFIHLCLQEYRTLLEELNLTGIYAHLCLQEDINNEENQKQKADYVRRASVIAANLNFVETELLEQEAALLKRMVTAYPDQQMYLEELLRKKDYILSLETEKTLSRLKFLFQTPLDIYNQVRLGDMKFPILEVGDEKYPINHLTFENFLLSHPDISIRHQAFQEFYKTLEKHQHTVAKTYDVQVQTEKALADLRGFPSVTNYLLFSQKATEELYHRQIDVGIQELSPYMRKYAKLIQRVHRLGKMTTMDLHLELDPGFSPKMTIDQARENILDGLECLGLDYQLLIKRAFQERWIDFADNAGKAIGAFTMVPYRSHPYILINWNGRMADTLILAHELGHAAHLYLSGQTQSILEVETSAYFNEAPSTTNELLLANHLLAKATEKRARRWILSQIISRTYYHNFVTHLLEATYQREVYRYVEAGGSLNAALLNDIYRAVLKQFWQTDVEIAEGYERTWMRQPHYYRGLYSYTYSAGLTIGTQMSQRFLAESKSAAADWQKVLRAGGTMDPITLSKLAGIDITNDKPLLDTIKTIGSYILEMVELTDELEKGENYADDLL